MLGSRCVQRERGGGGDTDLGVITFAMTCGFAIICRMSSGACPMPSMPYPPASYTTPPSPVTIHGPRAAIGTYGLVASGLYRPRNPSCNAVSVFVDSAVLGTIFDASFKACSSRARDLPPTRASAVTAFMMAWAEWAAGAR